jgi:uncharacterized protein (UPF0332 family)/predicted nucleotidyltransferase
MKNKALSPEVRDVVRGLKEYLLSSSEKEKIAKVILFGSHAKGEATPSSDIDILIVLTDGSRSEKSLLDSVYEFMIDRNAPLEVVTANLTQFCLSPDYFLHNVTRYGLEVYSMGKKDLKIAALNELKTLAEEYLESASEVLATNHIRLAIDAAYNASELAAKGLILLKKDDIPGSHGGVIGLFGQLYVKTNELEKELGRSLNQALMLRNEARYMPGARLSKEQAQSVIKLAAKLLEFIEKKLGKVGK